LSRFAANRAIQLAPKGQTGTGRFPAHVVPESPLIAIEFVVEAVGATPTVTYTIQGLRPGAESTDSAEWVDLMYLDMDSSVAASKAGIVATTVSRVVKYLDGLDRRFFEAIAVNVSANTNVTFRANLYQAG